MLCIHFIGCNIGFYGENCTTCPDNCLNDTCQFQIGHCFGCKDGFQGEMCEEGMKLLDIIMWIFPFACVSFKAAVIYFQAYLYVAKELSAQLNNEQKC